MNKIKKIVWAEKDISLLTELWMSNEPNQTILNAFPLVSYTNIRSKATRSLGLPARTNFSKNQSITWSTEEVDTLTVLWNTNAIHHTLRISIPNKTGKAIIAKAKRLNLENRPPSIRSDMMINRNKTMGRDLSEDNLIAISKLYKTKSEYIANDPSAYRAAKILGILDEKLATGITFNYPQTALFEILKMIFVGSVIKYNDRTTIYPKELDVYITDKRMAFEYDGMNFHSTTDALKQDNIKNLICKENNIQLFRIKESNKCDPIPSIINQLTLFGFDTANIDINSVKKEITKYYMSLDCIKLVIEKYNSFSLFRKENMKLYSFIKRNNLMGMLSAITPSPITQEEIVEKISRCSNKMEFIDKHHDLYIRFMKNKDLFPLVLIEYNLLPFKRYQSPILSH